MLKWSFAGQLVKITCFPPAWLLCYSWWDSNAYQIHSNNLFQHKGCPSLVGHSDGLCSYIYTSEGGTSLWAFHICIPRSFSSSWLSLDTTMCLFTCHLFVPDLHLVATLGLNTFKDQQGSPKHGVSGHWVSPQACSKNSSTHWAVSKIQTDPTLLSHR